MPRLPSSQFRTPLSISDWYNWKTPNPPFSLEKLQVLMRHLLETDSNGMLDVILVKHYWEIKSSGRKPKQATQSKSSHSRAWWIACWVSRKALWSRLGIYSHNQDVLPPTNQWGTNIAFVMPSNPEERRKIQKVEGFKGMEGSQLLELKKKCTYLQTYESYIWIMNYIDSAEDIQRNKLSCLVIAALTETDKKGYGEIEQGKGIKTHRHCSIKPWVQVWWYLDKSIHQAPCSSAELTSSFEALTTEEECRQATEGLLEILQALG